MSLCLTRVNYRLMQRTFQFKGNADELGRLKGEGSLDGVTNGVMTMLGYWLFGSGWMGLSLLLMGISA